MLPSPGAPPRGDQWIVELKADGARAMTAVHGGEVRIRSRPGNSLASRFPDVTAAVSAAFAGHSAVLDGELVVLDAQGRPDFNRLQRRLHLSRPSTLQQREKPAALWLFDVLHLDGRDMTGVPYRERRLVLESLISARSGPVVVPPAWSDIEGEELLGMVDELGAEGIVSKLSDSTYRPGRTRAWIKTPIRRSAHLLVAGYFSGRTMPVSALLLAGHDHRSGELRYCGSVSVGLGSRISRALHTEFVRHHAVRPPWRIDCQILDDGTEQLGGPVWLEPAVVARIEYREFTGRRLRHSAFKGLVAEADAGSVLLPHR